MTNADRSDVIHHVLASVSSAVRLVFFEQSIGCDSCTPTRQLLEQLSDMSPYLAIETFNLVLDTERAVRHRIDRVPAIVVCSPDRDRIRFYGPPFGNEVMSLLEAIRLTSSGDSGLTEASRTRLAGLPKPVSVQVFFTPTCTFCPQMVNLANRLAIESVQITATAIDATEYPDLVRRYNVNGVPKTIINDALEIIGAATEADVVEAVVKLAAEK